MRAKAIAYQGRAGCRDDRCRRFIGVEADQCLGWHCAMCDEPCGPQGHDCPKGDT